MIGREKSDFTTPKGGIYGVINKYGQVFIDGLKKKLEENDSIASRKLSQSVRFKIKIVGEIYVFEVRMEDYWKYVEEGRKPGKPPPIDSIVKWISQKGIPVKGKNKLKAARGLAYVIAKRIAKKGIRPKPFQKKTLTPQFLRDFQKDISKAAKREIEIEIKNIKEDLQ